MPYFIDRHGTNRHLNSALIQRQKLTDADIELILKLHQEREALEGAMETIHSECIQTKDPQQLTKLAAIYQEWLEIHAKLQDAWKFGRNPNWTPVHTAPGCTCPKLDNQDMLGSGKYYITDGCLYHSHNS